MEIRNNNTFNYTYSASEQEEIAAIRKKYIKSSENDEVDKLEQLRRLDEGTTKKSTVVSLIAGIVGTMVFGLGMSFVMVWSDTLFILGILIGIIGLAGIISAYPIYVVITNKEREKVAPQILKLTEELME